MKESSDKEGQSHAQKYSLLHIKLELCDTSLRKWIDKLQQKFTKYGDILNICFQIAVAVKFMHLKEIIHRDLKPGTIHI